MARLRKFVCYRRLERPYTRISKYKKKSFVKVKPHMVLVRFEMGAPNGKFDTVVNLVSKVDLQIRHNALEAARQGANRIFENEIGKGNYFMQIQVYPHHILRENPLASGAGADRFSTGMAHNFGKPISCAAQIKKGKIIFHAKINKAHIQLAKKAMSRAISKLPCKCAIVVENN